MNKSWSFVIVEKIELLSPHTLRLCTVVCTPFEIYGGFIEAKTNKCGAVMAHTKNIYQKFRHQLEILEK